MKKHLLSFVLLCFGLLLLLFIYIDKNTIEYPEIIFSQESKKFNDSFTKFIEQVEIDFETIQMNFQHQEKIRDTAVAQKFFLEYLDKSPILISTAILQNDYKIFVKKEDASLVYAVDSTKEQDIIKWKRYKNGKYISSYDESFEHSIKQTEWYKDLIKNNNEIRWYLGSNEESTHNQDENNELFYAGYSYKINDLNYILLMRISRQKLIENFNLNSKYDQYDFLLETSLGISMNMANDGLNKFNQDELSKDSTMIHKLNHFKNFEKDVSGIFNFSFNNEIYWNSFQRFPDRTGINYYMLTLTGSSIAKGKNVELKRILFWLAWLFISLGILLYLFKKRALNRSKILGIPPLREILIDEENRFLEFKSSARWDYRQEKVNPVLEKVILKTIAAFGNTDGGMLLIGVDDDKKVIGLEKDFNSLKKSDSDYYEVHLRNLFHKHMGVKYVSKHIRIQFEMVDHIHDVCIIKVLAANEALFIRTKNKNGQEEEQFFVRSGNSSQEIKSIAEINDYINTRFKNK